MNKKIMLFFIAGLCSSPMLTVNASAESMYKDIVQFCNTNTDASLWQYNYSLNDAIHLLTSKRQDLFNTMINCHTAKTNLDNVLVWAGSTAVFGALGSFSLYRGTYYPTKRLDDHVLAVMCFAYAGISTGAAFYSYYYNQVTAYFCKKKITEIDSAIEKLKAFMQQKEQTTMEIATL